jgi:hypothetical protein
MLLKLKEEKPELILNMVKGDLIMNNLTAAIALKRLLKEKGVHSIDLDELVKYIELNPEIKDTAHDIETLNLMLIKNIIKQKEKELEWLRKSIEEGK